MLQASEAVVADAEPTIAGSIAIAVAAAVLATPIPSGRPLPAGRRMVVQGPIAEVAPGPGIAGPTAEGQDFHAQKVWL